MPTSSGKTERLNFEDYEICSMFSRGKKPSVKKSTIVEETPLFAQLLPFANRMNDKVQLVNALAFTFIMGFSIFGIALWKLSGLT